MSAIGKKKQDKTQQIIGESPEDILQRRRALESRVGESNYSSSSGEPEQTGMAAEKAVGALCFLPKSLHRLATRAAEDRDTTAKRFFLETLLIGLEQQGVITNEQHLEALQLPNEYGWKGRKASSDISSSTSQ
ncbi:MAG: hypothetical protein J5732_02560 [Bacteroidaceae bacterium]|nr:hypothetical protein [Bacteroidaceae bacterium]